MKRKNDIDVNTLKVVEDKLKLIGLKVRTHRKVIENDYVKFAEKHQMNKVTLGRIENGENFKMSSLIQVLLAMDITLDAFFSDIK